MSIPEHKNFTGFLDWWKKYGKKMLPSKPFPGYKKVLTGLLAAGSGTVYYYWAHVVAAFHWVMAHNYTFMMLGVIFAALFARYKTPKESRGKNLHIFFPVITVIGYMFGMYATVYDPNMSAFIYVPGNFLGIEYYMVIEDWLFYPNFAFFFHEFYHFFLSREGNSDFSFKTSNIVKQFHFYGLILLTTFFLFFGAAGGRSLALVFAVPCLILFVPLWKIANARVLTIFLIFGVSTEVALDWVEATLLADINPTWTGWSYLGFDSNGNHTQSKFYLDYAKYPWAWFWGLFRTPVENSPWFGITGVYFVYFTTLGIEALNRFKKNISLKDLIPEYGKHKLKSLLPVSLICFGVLAIIVAIRLYYLSEGAY
jgi:hypothetical protein